MESATRSHMSNCFNLQFPVVLPRGHRVVYMGERGESTERASLRMAELIRRSKEDTK
jgi:hypothetical protein